MNVLNYNQADFCPLYIPFVHFFKDENDCYLEVLVNIKSNESITVETDGPETYDQIINLRVTTDSTIPGDSYRLVYLDGILLEAPTNPDEPRVIVNVVRDVITGEVAGTAIVRYRDIP